MPRALLPLAIAVALVSAGASRAQNGLEDPIHVYFGSEDCDAPMMELQLWDREERHWHPHPAHPRILADTCQVEDAGYLLNELRYRCVDPNGATEPGPWLVGIEVFEPGVVEVCGPVPLRADREALGVRITSPRPGSVVRDADQRVTIEGAVQIGGRDATGYDVLLLLDLSASTEKPLTPGGPSLKRLEVAAMRRLLESVAGRPDRVRVGLMATSTAFPGGVRLLAAPTTRHDRIRKLLTETLARKAQGRAAFTSGLEAAVDTLVPDLVASVAQGRQPVLLGLADGRPDLPFGSGVADDPEFRRRVDAGLARAGRHGVTVHLFVLGGRGGPQIDALAPDVERTGGRMLRLAEPAAIDALSLVPALPHVRGVVLHNRSVDASSQATMRPDGRFRATLPLRAGTNRVLATATASNGRKASVSVELTFDDSALRARLKEAEAGRIRRHRERQHKELEMKPQPGGAL